LQDRKTGGGAAGKPDVPYGAPKISLDVIAPPIMPYKFYRVGQ